MLFVWLIGIFNCFVILALAYGIWVLARNLRRDCAEITGLPDDADADTLMELKERVFAGRFQLLVAVILIPVFVVMLSLVLYFFAYGNSH